MRVEVTFRAEAASGLFAHESGKRFAAPLMVRKG